MLSLIALLIGFGLDLILGDPAGWPHIVCGLGKLISSFERLLRLAFPKTPKGELAAGAFLVLFMCALSLGFTIGILCLCQLVSVYLRITVESLLIWQCLSLKSLRNAGMAVYMHLIRKDLSAARAAVAEIVGRDTGALNERGVIRAAVETIAENTNDGIVAPLLFMALGGAPLGVLYKAINTMDSMIGYNNDRYLYFGRAAARLDDAVNFIPSRLAGVLMAFAALFINLDAKNALRIYWRDRLNHNSPNSAHTEAACAGALHVLLGGDNYYFGRLVPKPTIGDDDRPIDPDDIKRANRLLFVTSLLFLIICITVKGVIVWL